MRGGGTDELVVVAAITTMIDRRNAMMSPRVRAWERAMSKDPVCGMMVDEAKAAGKSEYQGKTYYFCAPVCKKKFDENPAKYAK